MAQLDDVQARVSAKMPLAHGLAETESSLRQRPKLVNIASRKHYALHVCRLHNEGRVAILDHVIVNVSPIAAKLMDAYLVVALFDQLVPSF